MAELTGLEVRVVNQTINRNKFEFDKNKLVDIKNKDNTSNIKTLKIIGYSKMAIAKAKNIYILSYEGLLLYLTLSENENKVYLEDFLNRYFKLSEKENKKVLNIRHEYHFGSLLKKSLNDICHFKNQYSVFSGKYRIDFYEPEFKLAIEYDEEGHFYNKKHIESDIIRQKEIEDYLHCTFIRVKKGEELQGLNKIIKFVINKK